MPDTGSVITDRRKLTGADHVHLTGEARAERYKLKARAWDLANKEKRRKSSRESKHRLRALRGRESYTMTWGAYDKKRKRDRKYSRLRYLKGLQSLSRRPRWDLSINYVPDGYDSADHTRCVIRSLGEIERCGLMIKEDYEASLTSTSR